MILYLYVGSGSIEHHALPSDQWCRKWLMSAGWLDLQVRRNIDHKRCRISYLTLASFCCPAGSPNRFCSCSVIPCLPDCVDPCLSDSVNCRGVPEN